MNVPSNLFEFAVLSIPVLGVLLLIYLIWAVQELRKIRSELTRRNDRG